MHCRLAATFALLCFYVPFESYSQSFQKTRVSQLEGSAISGETAQTLASADRVLVRVSGRVYSKSGAPSAPGKFELIENLVPFESQIHTIRVINGKLWVLKASIDPRYPQEPVIPPHLQPLTECQIIYSKDSGRNFLAANNRPFRQESLVPGSTEPFVEYASISQIGRHDVAGKPSLLVNAYLGPSVWASSDEGASWKSLNPSTGLGTMGYEGFFEVIGNTILFGGEHPLDVAYLSHGKLDPSGKVVDLKPSLVPADFDNRRVQFIRVSPFDSKVVFAGTEGGLLVSRDQGLSWKWSFKETGPSEPGVSETGAKSRANRTYPYIRSIVFPNAAHPEWVLAGGQPQWGLGTLLFSKDAGATWTDLSDTVLGENEFLGLDQGDDGTLFLVTRRPGDPSSMLLSKVAELWILEMH